MICKIYPLGTLLQYKYVVVLSYYDGHVLLSRHKKRDTWETQGGHVEAGETLEAAARRELYEESGARAYTLFPVFDYCVTDESDGTGAGGRVFYAKIEELASIPDSEMAEIGLFDVLPDKLTYPQITPVLFRAWKEMEKRDDDTL